MIKKILLSTCSILLFNLPALANNHAPILTYDNGAVEIYDISTATNPAPIQNNPQDIEHPVANTLAPSTTSNTTPIGSGVKTDDANEGESDTMSDTNSLGLWGAKWTGNANIGASLRQGNTDNNTLNADVTARARWEKHRAEIKADFNRTEDRNTLTVNNKSLEFIHDYFFQPSWFWENTLKFEVDEIDLLDLRTVFTTGVGHQVFEQDDLNLKYVGGFGFLSEDFQTSDNENLIANWSLDYNQKFYDTLFEIFHEHDLAVPVDATDEFLLQTESGIRLPIRAGIIASFQIDFDWDNAPVLGTVEDDTTYAFKLGYEW